MFSICVAGKQECIVFSACHPPTPPTATVGVAQPPVMRPPASTIGASSCSTATGSGSAPGSTPSRTAQPQGALAHKLEDPDLDSSEAPAPRPLSEEDYYYY